MYISAVIPTRDRTSDLEKTVDSITRQTRLPDELLVIDQSENNISKNLVSDLFAKKNCSINLKYIHDNSISGLVDAKKNAVLYSKGDIIMFLEDDVVLDIDYIKNMEQGFLDCPDMLGCCGLVSDLSRNGTLYQWFFHLFHRGLFYDKRVGVHGTSNRDLPGMISSSYLSGGLSAYRRTVFERVQFDTRNDFFMLEDIVFSTRAVREFGATRFFINTKAVLEHRMSSVNRDKLVLSYDRKIREYICFYKLNRDQKGAISNLVWLLLGLFIEAFFASLTSHSFGPIKGAFAGFVNGVRKRIYQPPTQESFKDQLSG